MEKIEKQFKFDFENSLTSQDIFQDYSKILFDEIDVIKKATKENKYTSDYSSIVLTQEKKFQEESKKLVKKFNDYDDFVLIGIGGSNLGTIAVLDSLKNISKQTNKNIYFVDTVDSYNISDILFKLEERIKAGKKIVINLISKSGGTTESIANFEIFLNFIKTHFPKNFNEHIVFTTDKNSPLDEIAKENKFHTLYLPKKVGGRYSVLSNVGLFPLEFMGINTSKLLKGADDMKKTCMKKTQDNPVIKSSISIFNSTNSNKNILNHFIFLSQLNSFGLWYRQLLGESIGKELSKDGKYKIHSGITPTTAIGSTDLHSMAQLYIGGPNDTYHIFLKINNVPQIKIPNMKQYDKIVNNIQNKNLSNVLNAIYDGTKFTFSQKNIPFSQIEIQDLNEYTLGALLQFKMFEVIYLARLIGVNPFDQPNVEEYKINTKEILKNG